MYQADLTFDKINPPDLDAVYSMAFKAGHSNWSKEDYEQEISRIDNISLSVKKGETIIAIIIVRLIKTNDYIPCAKDKSKDNEETVVKPLKRAKKTAEVCCDFSTPSKTTVNVSELEIYNIVVSEKFRKKGIGGALIDELFARIQTKIGSGKVTVWLEVRKSNQEAISFYTANQFRQCFERKNYYAQPTENALVLKREL